MAGVPAVFGPSPTTAWPLNSYPLTGSPHFGLSSLILIQTRRLALSTMFDHGFDCTFSMCIIMSGVPAVFGPSLLGITTRWPSTSSAFLPTRSPHFGLSLLIQVEIGKLMQGI